MEELLQLLIKDAQAAKFQPIRQAAQNALDVLNSKDDVERLPAHMLRERCLEPLHLALESKTKRLMTHAVSGIEKLLKDGRFQSSIETESEDKWLPIQILKTVYSTPNLPEDIQTDVMKLLLKMTFSTAWCMNSRIITQVTQVYIDTYSSSSASLKGIVQAALTQLLGSFAEKLRSAMQTVEHAEEDVMSHFNAKGNSKVESLTDDVVTLLNFLTDRVAAAAKAGQSKQAVPLLLEGILAIVSNSPAQLRNCEGFQQLVWQNLCPTLISLLGIPRAEPKPKPGGDAQRNVDTTNLSAGTAKIIYSISVEIAKMVGPVKSLRPVLESLFHRILICSSPVNRHDALKALKELLSGPTKLCDITVTYYDDNSRSGKSATQTNDLGLVKLIVDSVQECCHTSDSTLCYTCVMCVGDLLTSIEQLDRGIGIHADSVKVIKEKYQNKEKEKDTLERANSLTCPSDTEEAAQNMNNCNIHNSINNHSENNQLEDKLENKDTGKFVEHNVEKRDSLTRYKSVEKQSAIDFIQDMAEHLPYLLSLTTIPELDEALQKFSSQFSQKVSSSDKLCYTEESSTVTVLNADSIYSTSYSALSLSMNLTENGYYDNRDKTLIPVSERQFIDSVLDTDMFLYLSPDWLSTVYKSVLDRDLLGEAGWNHIDDTALVIALKDIDGEGSHAIGGQMMRGSILCEEDDSSTPACDSELVKAGKLLAGEILSTCWSGILDVLSVLLNGKSAIGVTNTFAIMIGTEGAKEESLRKREALCKCLDGLQTAAKLCCSLGLQERCEGVFSLLANTSCVMEDFKHATQPPVDRLSQKASILSQSKPKLVRLHAAHVLSMDAMMTTGLEIGSHSADCWKQVFRCCAFISELEHTYFSSGNNQSSLPRIQQEHAVDMATMEGDGDLYGVPVTPVVPVAPRINVQALIRQSSIESGWDRSISGGGVLNSVQASQALCGLSQQVDRMFEEAANNLNMTSLTAFLASLCESSKHQLHKITKTILEEEDFPGEHHNLPVNSLHLYRLQNVLMKVAHSDRPLIHLIKAWSVVSSYLVESAGHKDRSISKMAVTCVHDFIIAVMAGHSELQHFHTNEMLCKTFENILCLELCDGDVQDQIVCSICELVEASASDIRSGWRPLFGALRAVRIEYTTVEEVNEARQRHVEAVLDVFDVYLNTDNILVFANATVDCILCLLKYVRGPGEFEDSDTEDTDSVSDYMTSSPASENLVLPALNYLKQCCIILQSMWKMPACPVFHGAKRIQVDTTNRCVDRDIPNMDFKKFSKYFILDDEICDQLSADKSPSHEYMEKTAGDSSSLLSNDSGILLTANKESEDSKLETSVSNMAISLDQLDNHTGILHVWFLMLEGLSGAICACPRSYQPHTMETMFDLLRSASHVPGPKFVVYSMNHLLFPMLQSWLRSGSKKFGYWEAGATNFKQCCGHTTDLVVDLLHDFKDDEKTCKLIEEVLKQLLIVLTECVAQPFEVISRLGCSCIRHILLSAHMDFTEAMWKIVIDSLENALDVTTYCLRQLMLLFKINSENFYGDIGQVKVATRKDCTMMEFVRMWHLAQQVFLLDSQVSVEVPSVDSAEDKSYVFLLYPPGYENSLNPDHILARVPFRSIVVGLLSHQLLLQTVGCILLEGTDTPDSHMPGMLSQLTTKHVMQLLECLRNSYKLACEFDTRPCLKFLVQKVAHTPVAVNLYKQAGASMVFYIHTLIKICANIPDLDKEIVRALLLKESKNDTIEDDGKSDDDTGKRETGTVDKPDGIRNDNIDNTQSNNTENSISSKSEASTEEQSDTTAKIKETGKYKNVVDKEEKKGAQLTSYTKMSENTLELCSQIIVNNPKMFVSQLKTVCDELCQTYIDILYDKSGSSCVDTMSDQQLFFLIAQPDDFPELPTKHKVDAKQLSKKLEHTQARLQGQVLPLQAVGVQENGATTSQVTRQEKETVLPPLSPVHSQMKSKREMRTEQESRVYNLATDKLIKNLMTEYKKRKNQNAMPTFAKVNKKDNSDKKLKKKQSSSDPVEQVIEEQQQTSIMKDSEAHLQSWTELLCTILGLFDQLNDRKFTTLLPAVFESVNHLICHAQDMRLREELARWLHRVGDIYTLGPKME